MSNSCEPNSSFSIEADQTFEPLSDSGSVSWMIRLLAAGVCLIPAHRLKAILGQTNPIDKTTRSINTVVSGRRGSEVGEAGDVYLLSEIHEEELQATAPGEGL